MTLDDAIALAMRANRTLIAARLKTPAAEAGIAVAREIPNPELTFEETKETPRDALTLAQPIELGGKRRRRIAVAEAETRTASAETDAVAAEVRSQVRRAYAQLAAAQRRSAEAEGLAALAARTTEAARDRFTSGAAPRFEVLQTELASMQADNDKMGARAELSAARMELNALLSREPEAPLEAADDLEAGDVPPVETAVAWALAGSAELRAANRRLEAALARVDLARAGQYPDPALSGSITKRGEPEFHTGWRTSLTVTLPLFTHHHGAVVVEERTVDQLRGELEAAEAGVRARILAAASRAGALREQALHYRDEMLPRAAQIEAMAEDAYRSGQTNLVSMIQTIRLSRDVRSRGVQTGLDYQLALDELEQALGTPLPRRSTP